MRLAVFAMTGLLAASASAEAQGIHAVRKLDGYQCMSLAHVWSGQGPQPAPVTAYAGAAPGSPRAGFVPATAVVASPLRPQNGRVAVLWPNGRTVWANERDLVPFHVASDPDAVCTPVLLSNGHYGTTGKY